jgi:hypothetical protein
MALHAGNGAGLLGTGSVGSDWAAGVPRGCPAASMFMIDCGNMMVVTVLFVLRRGRERRGGKMAHYIIVA